MPLTREQRTLRARKAALTRSATEDTRAMTAPARSAFQRKFEQEAWEGIGPYRTDLLNAHPRLPEDTLHSMLEQEVLRRAVALRKVFYANLGLASARARQQKGRAVTRPSAISEEHDTPDASSQEDSTAAAEVGS